MRRYIHLFFSLVIATLIVSTVSSHAQDFPTKPIRIFVGASAGGLTDLFARIYANKLQERTGQPVLVENNAAATGTVVAGTVAKSAPDGYTLIMGFPANFTIWPIMNPKLAYDPHKDFAPIALVGKAANLLLTPKNSPLQSVQQLVAAAKAKPGHLTYASQGIGGTAHTAVEQFKLATGIDVIHVPYRGSAPAINAIIAGQVSFTIDTVPFTLPHVRAGTLNALAVADHMRSSVLPDVPTMAEVGVPKVIGGLWLALFAPANTPTTVIQYLNKQAQEIFDLPDVRERLEIQGLVLPKGSPEDLAKFMREEDARWRDVIQRAKIEFPH